MLSRTTHTIEELAAFLLGQDVEPKTSAPSVPDEVKGRIARPDYCVLPGKPVARCATKGCEGCAWNQPGTDPAEEQWKRDTAPSVRERDADGTTVYTWTFSKYLYPEIEDVKVALDEAGYDPYGYYRGAGADFAEPMEFEQHDDENWTVTQCVRKDV